MPPLWLTDSLAFPSTDAATEEGIVAVGGDVSPERLILAYSQGIFPWPMPGLPLLWFSPDPRFVLLPGRAHISRSLSKRLRRCPFEVRSDTAFAAVIAGCARTSRPRQRGTWITAELRAGYTRLHDLGLAHSIEAWEGEMLVGGLYGVSLGRAFFGESMFARRSDASKVAFAVLLAHLLEWEFHLIDCQVYTPHLERFGAELLPRADFLATLRSALSVPTRRGLWKLDMSPKDALEKLLVKTS